MGKKRSCRRSEDENRIHEKARSEGYNQGKGKARTINVADIIEEIGRVKGIGITKLADIKTILQKHLEG